jgi:hypothetical protein
MFCGKMLDFDVVIINVLQDCPDDSGDFRAAQCSEYDSILEYEYEKVLRP